MDKNDKFDYLPATANPLPPRRAQPRPYDGGIAVERPANTQTLKMRGTGAATKGTNYSPLKLDR